MAFLVTLACLFFALLVAAIVLLLVDARARRTETAVKLAAHEAAIVALQSHARQVWIAPPPDPSRLGPPSTRDPAAEAAARVDVVPVDIVERPAMVTPIPAPPPMPADVARALFDDDGAGDGDTGVRRRPSWSGVLGAGFRPPSKPPTDGGAS